MKENVMVAVCGALAGAALHLVIVSIRGKMDSQKQTAVYQDTLAMAKNLQDRNSTANSKPI